MPAASDRTVPRISAGSVAVVHDWLTGMRGGEKVLEAILELVPHADLYTLFHFEGEVSLEVTDRKVVTSRLQKLAGRVSNYRHLLPLYPVAVAEWDFSGYDLVISSSHCVAKGVTTGTTPHLCYCHTPMRYVWDRFDDYFPPRRPFVRFAAEVLAPALRRWDRETASSVDTFVANSSLVADRIGRYYERESTVIHPFVDDIFLQMPLEKERDDHHVVVSALVPYKRIEIAMQAAKQSGRRLEVIGDGPERMRLESSSSPGVRLLGRLPLDRMAAVVGSAQSLIIPGVEDFGITALEAMALGTPVIAAIDSGTRDVVEEGVTGTLFDRSEPRSLERAMERIESNVWDRERIRERAAEYTRERFQDEFIKEAESLLP